MRAKTASQNREKPPVTFIEKKQRRKNVLKEFKEFAMRGNVMDMAVGVIVGAAFGKIVSSLVEDVMMPPIGRLVGSLDFSSLFINLGSKPYETLAAAKAAGAPTLNYGLFLNSVINFLIVAFCVFLVVQQVNRPHLGFGDAVRTPEVELDRGRFALVILDVLKNRVDFLLRKLAAQIPAPGSIYRAFPSKALIPGGTDHRLLWSVSSQARAFVTDDKMRSSVPPTKRFSSLAF